MDSPAAFLVTKPTDKKIFLNNFCNLFVLPSFFPTFVGCDLLSLLSRNRAASQSRNHQKIGIRNSKCFLVDQFIQNLSRKFRGLESKGSSPMQFFFCHSSLTKGFIVKEKVERKEKFFSRHYKGRMATKKKLTSILVSELFHQRTHKIIVRWQRLVQEVILWTAISSNVFVNKCSVGRKNCFTDSFAEFAFIL